jgi:hypothetical protein
MVSTRSSGPSFLGAVLGPSFPGNQACLEAIVHGSAAPSSFPRVREMTGPISAVGLPSAPWGARISLQQMATKALSRVDLWTGVELHTIGHSTRPVDELVWTLCNVGVSTLVDIRSIPRSRHNPQFNADVLPVTLRAHALHYAHLSRLGGLRRARPDSLNTGWRNASFRGFADYISTDDFEAGLSELRELTVHGRVALMCAEAVPWRCHRSLIADVLTARGARVCHLTGRDHSALHRLTPFARVKGANVTYPGEPDGSAD